MQKIDIYLQLQQLIPNEFRVILKQDGKHLVIKLLNYCLIVSKLKNPEQLAIFARKHLSEELGDEIMGLGEKLIKQGIQQGMQQGIQQGLVKIKEEIAINMILEGAKLEFVAKVTGLSISDIERLAKQKP